MTDVAVHGGKGDAIRLLSMEGQRSSTIARSPMRRRIDQRHADEEVKHRLAETQLEAERADADALAAIVANPEIGAENHTILASLKKARTIERERCEIMRCNVERAMLFGDLEGEADEEEEEEASGFVSMMWIRSTTNYDEVGPSRAGVINISSDEE